MASDPPPGPGPNTRISNWEGSVRRYFAADVSNLLRAGLAATDKCLAQSNKSSTGAKRLKNSQSSAPCAAQSAIRPSARKGCTKRTCRHVSDEQKFLFQS